MALFQELRRRKMFRVAAVYAITAWLLIQIAATVEAPLNLPDWFDTLVIVLLAIGFPVTLVMAWSLGAHQASADEEKTPSETGISPPGRSKLDYAIVGLLVLAVGWLMYRTEFEQANAPEVPIAAEPSEADVLHNSIAVLPFENMSPNPDDAYFAAGIHEELLNQLAKIRDLSVIARTTMTRYVDSELSVPEIGRALNVGAVMEGSVRYAGDEVRITAQLIDVETGAHLWSEAYDRELKDIFGIQSDIALNITDAMKVQFSVAERKSIEKPPTDNPEALSLYLKALTLTDADLPQGPVLNLLDRAIELDPDFALAYASRAYLQSITFPYPGAKFDPETVAGRRSRARADAQRALELDPNQARAWLALATLATFDFRFADHFELTERAFALSPNDTWTIVALSNVRFQQRRYQECLKLIDRLTELDPANPFWSLHLAGIASWEQDYETALEAAQRAISLAPSFWFGYTALGRIQAQLGNREAAMNNAEKAFELVEGSKNFSAYTRLATVYGQAGQADKAREMIGLLEATAEERYVPAEEFVLGYLGANDPVKAREWFLAALDRHECWFTCQFAPASPEHPMLAPIRDVPEFRDLVERLKTAARRSPAYPPSN